MNAASIMPIFNAVANQLIEMNHPIRFTRVDAPDELCRIFRLRYDVVIERGWRTCDQLPDGMEKDAYDDDAVQLAAWDEGTLAATTRLIFPKAGQILPTEATFNMQIDPVGRSVDVGRTIIAPAYRDARQHRLLRGMIALVWLEVTQRGFVDFCATLSAEMLARYHTVGFEFYALGEAKMHWGQPRFPCKFDLMRTAQDLIARMNAPA
jgi:N-acyl-L-homoserine lactone synthetase